MKYPILKAPIVLNILIVLVSAFVSYFLLLFGIAHIVEGINNGGVRNPNIPESEHILGVVIVTLFCILGIFFVLLLIAAIRGIIFKLKERKNNLNTGNNN